MKLKVWNKILLVVGGLVMLLLGAALVVAACSDLVAYEVTNVAGIEITDSRWVDLAIFVGGVVVALFGLFALSIPHKLRYRRKAFVVQKTEGGELLIAVKAIETLVNRCIEMHEEIKLLSMRIISRKSTVAVNLRISLAGNVSIPLAVASLQKQIKQYLLASSGIEVSNVAVTVETTKGGDAKADSPYKVASQEAPARGKEKKAMHQRIFASKEETPVQTAQEEKPVQEVKEEKVQAPAEEAKVEEVKAEEPKTEEIVNEVKPEENQTAAEAAATEVKQEENV